MLNGPRPLVRTLTCDFVARKRMRPGVSNTKARWDICPWPIIISTVVRSWWCEFFASLTTQRISAGL
jgi:hypothetical protein